MTGSSREPALSADLLRAAGLPAEAALGFVSRMPAVTGDLTRDKTAHGAFWHGATSLLDQLPARPGRKDAETSAAQAIKRAVRETRLSFLRAHGEAIYDQITQRRQSFVRVERLVRDAAEALPGLLPSEAELAADAARPLAEKEGVEHDQGIFLSAMLANRTTGTHLLHSMLLPHPKTAAHQAKFATDGRLDLGAASIERKRAGVIVWSSNPRFLNAEDQSTIEALEICIDLAILDPNSEIAVLRGGKVEHHKYFGRNVFGAGINLTHLYHGRIPFVWYLQRELGYLTKLYRGIARADLPPDDVYGEPIEKPWIAAVEAFAIGGHCQTLLSCDHVIAERDAFLSLPARKEGIIPGPANLRLPRFLGDRLSRQAILFDRTLSCDSPEGRLICDTLAHDGMMDAAVDQAIDSFAGSGLVSARANRRALRIAQEPLDLQRQYYAVYAREQADCHFAPALIANLERHWNAASRKP